MKGIIRVIGALEAHLVPWFLVLPRPSLAWRIPTIQNLLKKQHIHLHHPDFCQYGVRWKKSTTIMSSRIDPLNAQRLDLKCRPSRNGLCSATKKFHVKLDGHNKSGYKMASIAAGIPQHLARDLSFCLIDDYRSSAGFS